MHHMGSASLHLTLTLPSRKVLSSLARQTATINPDDQVEQRAFRDLADISNSREFKDY